MTLREFLEGLNPLYYRGYTVNVYTSDYVAKTLEIFEFKNYKASKSLETSVLSYSDFSGGSQLDVFVNVFEEKRNA